MRCISGIQHYEFSVSIGHFHGLIQPRELETSRDKFALLLPNEFRSIIPAAIGKKQGDAASAGASFNSLG
ncbi:hypothetical protein MKK75_13100 [Methylobacterium sp. J-030]|uniref:hypothetical protein n=1 Tax=Methylobacterium sp. J-030 TaxID=2836627 RepID=UPI001FBBCB91|nr:hypothetical protein [Methylobacterium sp. J-030]MCJ2069715.1 hypothetical protein [Methylobacterium sp. J-030]